MVAGVEGVAVVHGQAPVAAQFTFAASFKRPIAAAARAIIQVDVPKPGGWGRRGGASAGWAPGPGGFRKPWRPPADRAGAVATDYAAACRCPCRRRHRRGWRRWSRNSDAR